MAWVVGVDEAGYGPNLGPLAQAAVAVRLPAGDAAGWAALAPWVRRHGEKDKARLLVDDSKLVHQGRHGLARLEAVCRALLGLSSPAGSGAASAAVAVAGRPAGPTVGAYLAPVALPGVLADLAREAWFDPGMGLPLFPDPVADLAPVLGAAGSGVRVVGVNLVPAPVFNRVVAGSNSKATVLAAGLVGLLGRVLARLPADGDEVVVVADKQGGRAVYGHLLAAAFPAGVVTCEVETAAASRYRVDGLPRPVRLCVQPEADAASVAVALASCLAKYTREVCMRQFNAYWQGHLPGLKPTAGYPLDARWFYGEIRPLLAGLGLPEAAVWRVK